MSGFTSSAAATSHQFGISQPKLRVQSAGQADALPEECRRGLCPDALGAESFAGHRDVPVITLAIEPSSNLRTCDENVRGFGANAAQAGTFFSAPGLSRRFP
jgi:hypothetical protein